jgi:large subunit ribosomal protein L13
MDEKIERKTHTIDAAGKVLGRLAAEISVLLRAKNSPNFLPRLDMGDFVVVKNIDKIKITGRKLDNKIYYRHSGLLGHLKKTTMKRLIAKKPGEALKQAVYGMLPKNKLRAKQIKRLKIG